MLSTEVMMDECLEKRILPDKLTILYVGLKYDYGQPGWGLSYEHYNFYQTFLNMGYSLIYFPYDSIQMKYGIDQPTLSKMLLEAVYYYSPDVLFYFNYKDWIDHSVWEEVSKSLPTRTIIWLGDDHWRYSETKEVWKLFNLIVTTDKIGYDRREGNYDAYNTFLSQWGCNHLLYRNLNLEKIYDVTFVGRCYGDRKEFIESLRDGGINITTFGQGWDGDSKRISQVDMIKIYNQSKIVLNMSFSDNGTYMIKGRDFEVPSCGSLLLTHESEEIHKYFNPGHEIVTYKHIDDAVKLIKDYLKDEETLNRVSEAGYKRALKDHTYTKRLEEVINAGME